MIRLNKFGLKIYNNAKIRQMLDPNKEIRLQLQNTNVPNNTLKKSRFPSNI